MNNPLRLAAWLVLASGMGCQSNRHASSEGGTGRRPPMLSMYVRDATFAEEFYEIDRNDQLGFGGGLDARFNRATWNIAMTADEQMELNTLIERLDWMGGDLKSTHEPPKFIYRIQVRNETGHARYDLKGDHPQVSPIRELLHAISLRRLEPELQKLPEPGKQPG